MSWLIMRGDYPACQDDSNADELKNGEYVRPVRLNSTGAYIWKQLDEKKEKEETYEVKSSISELSSASV